MITRRLIICFILSALVSACTLIDSAPQRVVRVAVFADTQYRKSNINWQPDIEAKFRAASDFFEDEFAIRLVLADVQPWQNAPPPSSIPQLISLLKKDIGPIRARNKYDVVIGVTALPGRLMPGHGRVDEIGNCADGLGNYVGISANQALSGRDREALLGNIDVATLIHELGHIFGAEHAKERDSIMAVNFNLYSDFDAANRAVILKNRHCRFRED